MRMDIPGIIFVRARLVLESHSVQVVEGTRLKYVECNVGLFIVN